MISYDPLWETLRKKGISTYKLTEDYAFSRGTLDSLKQNRNVSTSTINKLCTILMCEVGDIMRYVPDKE